MKFSFAEQKQRFDCGTNDELAKSNLKLTLMQNPALRAYAKELLDTILV